MLLDDPEQPQDKNEDQDSAKTDIHGSTPLLVLTVKRLRYPAGCTRFVSGLNSQGIILPVRKVPDLLDFCYLGRD
jgi:hypothetical protein